MTWANEAAAIAHDSLARLAYLVGRMRCGDEQALEELYDATVGKLFAVAKAGRIPA